MLTKAQDVDDGHDPNGGALADSIERTTPALDWTTFHSQLRAFVAARVPSASDTDDLVQRILERALTHAGDIEDQRKAAGWLFAIARNAIRDHYRGGRVAGSAEPDA